MFIICGCGVKRYTFAFHLSTDFSLAELKVNSQGGLTLLFQRPQIDFECISCQHNLYRVDEEAAPKLTNRTKV